MQLAVSPGPLLPSETPQPLSLSLSLHLDACVNHLSRYMPFKSAKEQLKRFRDKAGHFVRRVNGSSQDSSTPPTPSPPLQPLASPSLDSILFPVPGPHVPLRLNPHLHQLYALATRAREPVPPELAQVTEDALRWLVVDQAVSEGNPCASYLDEGLLERTLDAIGRDSFGYAIRAVRDVSQTRTRSPVMLLS